MKVLMLGWELPPHNSGGLGKACYQLCRALSSKGIDIEFILPYMHREPIDFMRVTCASPEGAIEIQKSGIAYDSYLYRMKDGTEEWVDIFGQQQMYERAVSRIVEQQEFDIIHAHDWLTFRAAMQAKMKTGCPVILHVHSIEHDRAGGRLGNHLVHEIEYMAMLTADRIIAVSNHTKQAITREYNIPADKIEVVHNSIDIDLDFDIASSNEYAYLAAMKQKGYQVITNAGRLTIQKGISNLLDAVRLVIQQSPKTLFLIVGTGEQDFELIEKAARLGISRHVIFTGFQRGNRLRDAFAIADLFVMPSISEPFGLTPLEAAGHGTPSLISKQSGVSEVLRNCLKVDFWDIEEMANQMCAFIRNSPLRFELQQGVRQEYANLSWQPAAERVHDLYHQQLVVS